jgi:uncharacterized protein YajQ (UPF0234 family)
MPSFDIVSEIDMNEARNACDNSNRELATRFDFRGVEASFEFLDDKIKMKAEGEFQIQQMTDMLRNNCMRRNLDPESVDSSADLEISGKSYSKVVSFKQGIEQDMAKKIVKLIKDSKMKVQASIQGDKVRVQGKKRDDLQQAMQLVKTGGLGQPFQFNNFRD